MSFIRSLPDHDATGRARELFDEDVRKDGYVWNLTRVLAHRPAVVDALRRHGLSDPEILDVALAAAARAFFTKTLDGVGVQPDAAYMGLEPALRDALTVGRAIAPGETR